MASGRTVLPSRRLDAMKPTWLDESKYKYNGSFKPESNAARSAMNRVQNTTGVVESYSGDANAFMAITAALADGNNIGKAAGVNGAITAAANIYTNGVNTRDAKEELEMMRGDMEQIMSSPCYHKLTQSQKDMVDEAYDEFMQWYKTAHNHLTGVAQIDYSLATRTMGLDIGRLCWSEALFDAAGKLRLDRAGLISFSHGEYFAAGQKVGEFGFSVRKKK